MLVGALGAVGRRRRRRRPDRRRSAAGVLLAVAVNFAAAVGRLAFESIVQRDAPQANRGRAFAQFETRFQFAWAIAGLIPVLIVIPGWVGFLVVGLVSAVALVNYVAGTRSSTLRLRRRRLPRPQIPWRRRPGRVDRCRRRGPRAAATRP